VTDIFLRWWPESDLRRLLGEAVIARLALQTDGRVHVLAARESRPPRRKTATKAFLERDNFQARSRIVADSMARSQVYVLIDDDHLPIGKDWIQRGVSTLLQNPDYAMLSAWSINGEVRDPGGEGDIFETQSAGTPCFVRKGTFEQVPYGPADSYDSKLSDHLRGTIGRIGFLRNVRFNHLGCGYSQVVAGHWGA